ncbi:hypothetical protein AOX55_0000444 [Sinorhizobium fredii CCBAU 25509]|nr:hypothetical protein AOX55_0000444 [Sinorhizobium fredii CCBAU 25509]
MVSSPQEVTHHQSLKREATGEDRAADNNVRPRWAVIVDAVIACTILDGKFECLQDFGQMCEDCFQRNRWGVRDLGWETSLFFLPDIRQGAAHLRTGIEDLVAVDVNPALDQRCQALVRADKGGCVHKHCHMLPCITTSPASSAASKEIEDRPLQAICHVWLEGITLPPIARLHQALVLRRNVSDHIQPLLFRKDILGVGRRSAEEFLGTEVASWLLKGRYEIARIKVVEFLTVATVWIDQHICKGGRRVSDI